MTEMAEAMGYREILEASGVMRPVGRSKHRLQGAIPPVPVAPGSPADRDGIGGDHALPGVSLGVFPDPNVAYLVADGRLVYDIVVRVSVDASGAAELPGFPGSTMTEENGEPDADPPVSGLDLELGRVQALAQELVDSELFLTRLKPRILESPGGGVHRVDTYSGGGF